MKNQIWLTGHGQFDVPHAFAAHARQGHFHTAAVADHSAMLDAFVFAAITLPITYRTENAFAKQTTFFGLERAVINCLGVLDFPVGPRTDGIRRRHTNTDLVEGVRLFQTERGARGGRGRRDRG